MMIPHIFFWACLALGYNTKYPIDNDRCKLIVEVDNIIHTNGQLLRIAVSNKEDFLSDNKPKHYAIIEARQNNTSYTFILPKGDFAISVYHDLNGNDKLDKNFLGAPTEPFGFSRNYKPLIRAPKFEEAQINLASDRKIIISLIQP